MLYEYNRVFHPKAPRPNHVCPHNNYPAATVYLWVS